MRKRKPVKPAKSVKPKVQQKSTEAQKTDNGEDPKRFLSMAANLPFDRIPADLVEQYSIDKGQVYEGKFRQERVARLLERKAEVERELTEAQQELLDYRNSVSDNFTAKGAYRLLGDIAVNGETGTGNRVRIDRLAERLQRDSLKQG